MDTTEEIYIEEQSALPEALLTIKYNFLYHLILICSIIILLIGILILAYTIYNNTRGASYYGKFNLVSLICFYISSIILIISAIILMIVYFMGFRYKEKNGKYGIKYKSWYGLVIIAIIMIFIAMVVMLIFTIISHASNSIATFESWFYIVVYVISIILLLVMIALIICYIYRPNKSLEVTFDDLDNDDDRQCE